jgi:hypothetical protein
LVEAADAAGVPVIAPVDVLSESPDGRAGEIAKVIGDVPPDAVTGVNDVADVPALIVWVAIARVVVSADETVSANVLALVALLESVAVIV